ncbi:acyltransferase [Desulfatitalea tepidiphila]|uniref:acyltransferase n=1 Tax=Desulfatitalea tepidiphila TaxID=1185843 RepID=UPI0009FA19A7|nr:acyltransferase [Desulfatitalea tepidiphila]
MIVNSIKSIYEAILRKKRERYLLSLVHRGLNLGKNVEIIADFFFDPSHCFLITIGDDCTICPNVRLIAHDASTKKHLGFTKIGRIHIGPRCFLGDSVIVLPNTIIGAECIIGAGSVVTKDVPEKSVVAGSPAKIICSTEDYLIRLKQASSLKLVFGQDYYIERLNDIKRERIINSVNDGIGFIV